MKVEELLSTIDYVSLHGSPKKIVTDIGVIGVDSGSNMTLFWCKKSKETLLNTIINGIVIVDEDVSEELFNPKCFYIKVTNPRREFMKVMKKYFNKKPSYCISESANISPLVFLPDHVFIGDNVVIEENCEIGVNVYIQHNTVIHKGTAIGDNVYIGANCTIGGVGFGYERDDNGDLQEIPHIGNVVIKNNVDIGNNTCIDRAVLGSTTIGENTKIDNLVHIAHGVNIGRNCAIIANSMVAGSVVIGDNSWVAPSVSILNQKKIGNNVVVGLGAVVIKDVTDNDVVVGNPSKSIKK